MKIGDGSATVTEYEFPKATVRLAPLADGKAGTRSEVRSQDNGLAVLVGLERLGALLRKEKDEASRVEQFSRGVSECLHSRICRRVKVFCW